MLQLNENYSNGNNIAVLGTANPSEMGKIFLIMVIMLPCVYGKALFM